MNYRFLPVLLLFAVFFLCSCEERPVVLSPTAGAPSPSAATGPTDPPATPTATGTPSPSPTPTPTPIPDYLIPEWWVENRTSDDVILTYSQIRQRNKDNASMTSLRLLNLSTVKPYKATQVAGLIKEYSFPNNREYIDGRKVTNADKNLVTGNRNLDALKTLNQRYAVVTENASIKMLPSRSRVTNEDGKYDYLQESGENIGEPLIVLHESKDGEWYFVRATDCFGWILKTSVGLCSREQFDEVCNAFYNGKVRCAMESGEYTFEPSKLYSSVRPARTLYIRLGTYFLCEDDSDNVIIPTRNSDGNADFIKYIVRSEKIAKLLPFTTRNVVKLATTLLGMPYSWGDEDELGMDCSSTVKSIYKCFGFILPRNSGSQRNISAAKKDISKLDAAEKRAYILGQPAGTLLYMQGHIMVLLGEYDGEPYVLHNTTNTELDDGTFAEFNSCVITDLNVGKTGNLYIDRLLTTINITTGK
ncbi:MAG: SH3 domain-containing protein [Lachnospiraceae bacterium]|nr:SH3 domain-containing protein [Lachnospiraceae bacterium]